MDKQIVIAKANHLINTTFPNSFSKTIFYKDEGSFIDFDLIIDDYLGIEINIDFMDKLISFFMLKLKNGRPYEHGYYSNKEAGTIRLYFQSVLKYFNLPFDSKESKQLMYFENNEDDLIRRMKENITFYKPIFQNENNILSELHKPEIWEKIKSQS